MFDVLNRHKSFWELQSLPTVIEDLRVSHESWNRYVHLLSLLIAVLADTDLDFGPTLLSAREKVSKQVSGRCPSEITWGFVITFRDCTDTLVSRSICESSPRTALETILSQG